MINSITMKKVATFADTGVQISDLKKVNFFFGFNGSGKSTIAKYIHNLGAELSKQIPGFESCSNIGYDPASQWILTFNDTFVQENFIRSTELKGVFSLNQANARIDELIKDAETQVIALEKQINRYDTLDKKIKLDKKKNADDLLEYCWEQRNIFGAYSKISLAHSGRKENNIRKIKEKLKILPTSIPSIEELNYEYQLLYEKEIKNVSTEIDISMYKDIRRVESGLNELLHEVIIGKEDVDIAHLINSLKIRSWVETGLGYLDQTGGVCPFCQKNTIDKSLREQFERFFDDTYREKIKLLQTLKSEYEQTIKKFLTSLTNIENEFNPDNLVSSTIRKLERISSANIEIINSKINYPNEIKTISSVNSKELALSQLLSKIVTNNKIYSQLNIKKEAFEEKIWEFMAQKCEINIRAFNTREKKYQRIIESISNYISDRHKVIDDINQDIDDLRSHTVNTKEAVDKINIILKNAGFNGFQIKERETKNNISLYFLKRPNETETRSVFETLSEGEKSFIAFLYFYQLCIGTDDINKSNKKKIIVIDDPVSSLDSQALFLVSTLIHSLIRRKGENPNSDKKQFHNINIKQVFIFTHNFYFYKEVSFEKRPICTDSWHYYISKSGDCSIVEGNEKRKVFDEYSLMWSTIKKIKSSPGNDPYMNIMVSNTMRRIIESYVNFIGLGKDSWASLFQGDIHDPNYYIKCAFISSINDESHKIGVLDNLYYQKIVIEQPQNLFNVFAKIFKEIGKEHYELMMNEQLE